MHLGSSNEDCSYQMGGSNIDQVHMEKDLGLIIDERLKFHEQVAAAVIRANRIFWSGEKGIHNPRQSFSASVV